MKTNGKLLMSKMMKFWGGRISCLSGASKSMTGKPSGYSKHSRDSSDLYSSRVSHKTNPVMN